MKKLKVVARCKALEAARSVLDRLDLEVGPRAYAVLRGALERAPLSGDDLAQVQAVANELVAGLRDARERLAGEGDFFANKPCGLLAEIELGAARASARVAEAAPEGQRAALVRAIRYLGYAEDVVRTASAQLGIEITLRFRNRNATWRVPAATHTSQKNACRPKNPNHATWYAEICNLRTVYGTWQKAVEAFNRCYGTDHTVERVKKWGQRASKPGAA